VRQRSRRTCASRRRWETCASAVRQQRDRSLADGQHDDAGGMVCGLLKQLAGCKAIYTGNLMPLVLQDVRYTLMNAGCYNMCYVRPTCQRCKR
jgi:hypothetical protein